MISTDSSVLKYGTGARRTQPDLTPLATLGLGTMGWAGHKPVEGKPSGTLTLSYRVDLDRRSTGSARTPSAREIRPLDQTYYYHFALCIS